MRLAPFTRAVRRTGAGCLLLAAFLCGRAGHAQPGTPPRERAPEATYYASAQGLPNTSVYALARDAQGFLWAGTGYGLSRFDGYTFRVFLPDEQDTTALADGFVGTLLADGETLWVGTGRGGLQRLDLTTERFTRFRMRPEAPPGHLTDRIAALARTSDALWVGTLGGLFQLDPATGRAQARFTAQDEAGALPAPQVRALLPDRSGLWIGTDGGLVRYDEVAGTLTPVPGVPGVVLTLAATRGTTVLVGTTQGLFALSTPTRPPQRVALSTTGFVYHVVVQEDGTRWAATHAGLARQLPDEASFRFLTTADTRALSLDRTQNVWAGTVGAGLLRMHLPLPAFHLLDAARAISGLTARQGGGAWAGSESGLLRIAPGGQAVQVEAALGTVRAVARGLNGQLVVATPTGLARYTPGAGPAVPLRPAGLPARFTTNNLLVDRTGALWVSTMEEGVIRVDPAGRQARVYRPGAPGGFPHEFAWALLEARDGTLWVGTMGGGLARFDQARGAFASYRHSTTPTSLPSDRVVALHEARDGTLWVGTMGGGLARFDRATDQFTIWGPDQGLAEPHVYGLTSDAGGLWIASSTTLSRLDLRTGRLASFAERDGLPTGNFRWNQAVRGFDGTLYFGSSAELLAFHPDDLPAPPAPPPLRLTEVRLFNRPLGTGRPPLRMRLPHHQNFLSFTFAALDLNAPHVYRYRLDGLDTSWVLAGARTFADYPGLNPGHYRLHVQAASVGSNVYASAPTLGLIITPPFWQTWWFRTLAALLLTGALYALYRYRLTQLLRVERARRRIADDLHDDLGTKLSTLATQLEVSGQYGTQEAAPSALIGFAAQTRTLVTDLRDTVWFIDAQRDTLASLTDRLETAAYNLLGADRFRFARPDALPDVLLPMEQRRHLFLLLKEALHNAHRHAAPSIVRLRVEADARQACFTVEDAGPGFDLAADPGKGNGLGALRRRAEAAGVYLQVQSAPGEGTRVQATLPLPQRRRLAHPT